MQCHRFFPGLITSDGLSSAWNGHRPVMSAPVRASTTPAASASETSGTSAFSRSISASGTRATPPSPKNLGLSSGGNMVCHEMHIMASGRATGGNMNVISAAQWATRDDHGGHDMPSPFIPGRLRELRAEAGLSQAGLAARIGSDARQVSRYENGRVSPSLKAAARIAETFNITLDYLLIPDAPRRPLRSPGGLTDAKLADLAQLTDDERATIANVIDAITTKARLRLITGNAS